MQDLMMHLLDSDTAKSLMTGIAQHLSLEHLKEIMEHLRRFLSEKAAQAKQLVSEELERAKELLAPLIAQAIEKSGADTDKLKDLLAQLASYANQSKLAELAGKVVEHAPVDKAKALISDGLAKLDVDQLRTHITEALTHLADSAHEKLAPFLAAVLARLHTPGDTEGLKHTLGDVLAKLHSLGEEGKAKATALEAALHDQTASAKERIEALGTSLQALDTETMKAMVQAVMARAMANSQKAKETLSEMAQMASTAEGRHLLAAQAHALVLSSKNHLKVSSLLSRSIWCFDSA